MLSTVRRLRPALGLAAHIGHGVQRVATDAALGRLRRFPRRISELDAGHLSTVMGRTVRTLSVLGGDAGTSSRARLSLTGDGVPETVFVKLPAEAAATRLIGELGRLAHTEVRFYQQLAQGLPGVPRSHGSAFDAPTGRFVLVLEDLAEQHCEFPDTLHPLDKDRAALTVELLARVHACFWGRLPARSGQGPLGWLYSASGDDTSLLTGELLKMSSRRLAERTDIPVQDGRFVDENYRAAAALLDRPPHTVMHGDAHPGNLFFRNGEAGLLDWQAVRRGHPGRELAYTLITSMTTTDRQAAERDLLEEYRRSLTAAGGPTLHSGELWERYRLGAVYAYTAPVITAGLGGMQDDRIAVEGARHGVAALADLETVALLKKLL
ncbi:phosphotransferase [Mycolicibacterium goodii]|uniref:Ecdysteroid 22-kinase family protein n=1 Tax=Mycolicibacterium goodii TaxID=134601 RepID=A0ABS6HIQ9_MYCGD|nr:phosphotransferase [Mycolicibacterium goodii]MBU8822557.1 ecdysteroid 22-kinase family protein [Mycolicibacterium goodii]MBU8829606.1 ecdysteroid 22-kinase family protein [Mycolicibacterium goodii]MBU8835170.1 ecdysteroid 22-kinase family protein [Mycolicibacterium goodii]